MGKPTLLRMLNGKTAVTPALSKLVHYALDKDDSIIIASMVYLYGVLGVLVVQ